MPTKSIVEIKHEDGLAYIAKTRCPKLSSHKCPSTACVLEDGVPLPGPPNAMHADIRLLGAGRYSFWHDCVYFSTSDNSDPRVNGRNYAIEYEPFAVDRAAARIFNRWRWHGRPVAAWAKTLWNRAPSKESWWGGFYRICFAYVLYRRGMPSRRKRDRLGPPAPSPLPQGQRPVNYQTRDASSKKLQEDVDYAAQVGKCWLRLLSERNIRLSGQVILEIGPGINYGSTLLLACLGAKVMVADRFLAPWDVNYHERFYSLLRDWISRNIPEADPAPIDRILSAGGYVPESIRCYPTSLEELRHIEDRSVDIIFSNAVLEHLVDPPPAFTQLERVSRKGARGFHQVDFRDHTDFSRPLEFLLVDDPTFAREFAEKHGERGNRYRQSEYAAFFERAGFHVHEFVPSCFADESYLADFLPRIRRAGSSKYQSASLRDLREISGLFSVEKI